jgi:hypothetical protein
MPEQLIILTVMARGVSQERRTLPVSVLVSPRLSGAEDLGQFPDWLTWPHALQARPLTLTFRCGQRTHRANVSGKALRTDLWEALFNEKSLVRPYTFDDYSDREVISFSVRDALSAIKLIYQEAGLSLALPDGDQVRGKEGLRGRLDSLVNGLNVEWGPETARKGRAFVRDQNSSLRAATAGRAFSDPADPEGLSTGHLSSSTLQATALPFSVFHHMPTPSAEDELKIDPETVLDFHSALTALNSYPMLQRALGLVFDVDLPANFVPTFKPGEVTTISVGIDDYSSRIETEWRSPETAVVNMATTEQDRVFFTAPRAVTGSEKAIGVLGLLNLDPRAFGLAQVDVDGGMFKAINLANALHAPTHDRRVVGGTETEHAPHPQLHDPDATLPSLRSGGFSLFADQRGARLLEQIREGAGLNTSTENGNPLSRPFFAEDLVRGYRIDIWNSDTNAWHSLHRRSGTYVCGNVVIESEDEEGFVQPAATQPAPGADADNHDLYVHEAVARWNGWSLSVERPGKHLSHHGDPDKAVPPDEPDDDYSFDEPLTPFGMHATFAVTPGSLPKLRVGSRYRIRARGVDLAGNGLALDDPFADSFSMIFALPRDPGGVPYLRYEPVESPIVIPRDPAALQSPGSEQDRIVIRTYNATKEQDDNAADQAANDRHIIPPRISIEMGEQLRMFDAEDGSLKSDAATWKRLAELDDGTFPHQTIDVAGKEQAHPIQTDAEIDSLPHLPDLFARGAALRDLPGTPDGAVARVTPFSGEDGPVTYQALSDPNPRRGSATLVRFQEDGDWGKCLPFRLALEGVGEGGETAPYWDPESRLLTVRLPAGAMSSTALSSFLDPRDLELMGVWQWVREYVERLAIMGASPKYLRPGEADDVIAHVLQRTVEGGHWMLSPPRILTFVHAVQQPIGLPAFEALNVDVRSDALGPQPLQTAPIRGRQDPTELAPLTAWRRLGSTDASLIGSLRLHIPSTAQVDIKAEWVDPIDDMSEDMWKHRPRSEHVELVPLGEQREGYVYASGSPPRPVGYLDPENSQVAFTRRGQVSRHPIDGQSITFWDAAPVHQLHDTKHHRVRYTAVGASRFREYFEDQELDFTRKSRSVEVRIPASKRPLAPDVLYVMPTFGWQRQIDTNIRRSVRFGGGLRIYMNRPWFSSGVGELLGVTLYPHLSGPISEAKRNAYQPYITQWGMDPIWETGPLAGVPVINHFPDAVSSDVNVSLDERPLIAPRQFGLVDVVGFEAVYDEERKLWFSDLTINTYSNTYSPFVRLALVRYQPDALAHARVSRVVLADFAQLTPDRSVVVTADPHRARVLRVVISGVAPRGPQVPTTAEIRGPTRHPTEFRVRVQQRNEALPDSIGWSDVSADVAAVTSFYDRFHPSHQDLALWVGAVSFANPPALGVYRLLIEEFELIFDPTVARAESRRPVSRRLIFAETVPLG